MNRLILFKDNDCEMEKLELNGKIIGFGNFWDENCLDRFSAVVKALDILGIEYEARTDRTWKYE